jgi:hypothetical protein
VNGESFLTRHGMHFINAHGITGPDDRGEITRLVQALGENGEVVLPLCQNPVEPFLSI